MSWVPLLGSDRTRAGGVPADCVLIEQSVWLKITAKLRLLWQLSFKWHWLPSVTLCSFSDTSLVTHSYPKTEPFPLMWHYYSDIPKGVGDSFDMRPPLLEQQEVGPLPTDSPSPLSFLLPLPVGLQSTQSVPKLIFQSLTVFHSARSLGQAESWYWCVCLCVCVYLCVCAPSRSLDL